MMHPNNAAFEYLDMGTLHLSGTVSCLRVKRHPASAPANVLVRICGEVSDGDSFGTVRRGRVPGCAGRRDRRSSLQHTSPGPYKILPSCSLLWALYVLRSSMS